MEDRLVIDRTLFLTTLTYYNQSFASVTLVSKHVWKIWPVSEELWVRLLVKMAIGFFYLTRGCTPDHRGIDPIVTGSWDPQFFTLCYSLPIHFQGTC